MSRRADEGVENSECDSRLALGRETSVALLFAVTEPNVEPLYALIPNREAETGSIFHPIWELVSLDHYPANRQTLVLNLW
jgi:hypothetical protein